ncbi:MAG: hypothetical protein M1829_004530 [Trizodia sp. TS-e1964]|nr:MAG: hypothetical protein M1829_004530 [Trizodia sp. TS-e1964]
MGAIIKRDLTSDVTHLIVGDIDTAKYKFVARERSDVRVMRPEWIEALRTIWIEGEEPDVVALEKEYQLPTFAGLKICLTGFGDPVERQALVDVINSNGATYHGDLTKLVTHLITNKTQGDKYKFARAWGIKVVAIEWLKDSLERGMTLDEELYNPLKPTEERGIGAWIRRSPSLSSLGKHARDKSDSQLMLDHAQNPRRKLRRTASAKLQGQDSGIWDDIVGGGFTSKKEAPAKNEWEDHQRSNRAAEETRTSRGTERPADGVQKVSTREKENIEPGTQPDTLPTAQLNTKGGIFSNGKFHLYGFDERQTSILKSHLVSNGAKIVSSIAQLTQNTQSEALSSILLIPHDLAPRHRPLIPASLNPVSIVTEMWVEKCLYGRVFINPQEDAACRPFPLFPLPGFQNLTIASTAFTGVDLMQLPKILSLMGATYAEYLSASSSVLLCGHLPSKSAKLKHAFEWNVPAISAQWLWACVEAGRKLPFDDYLVDATAPPKLSRPSTAQAQVHAANLDRNLPNRGAEERNRPTRPSPQSPKITDRRPCTPDLPVEVQLVDESFGIADSVAHEVQNKPPLSPNPSITAPTDVAAIANVESGNSPPPKLPHMPPQPPDIQSEITSLLQRQRNNIAHQSHSSVSTNALKGRKRPERLLGRASSNISARSASFSYTSSVDSTSSNPAAAVIGFNKPAVPAERSANHHTSTADSPPATPLIGAEIAPPSQTIKYDDAAAQAHRKKVQRMIVNATINGVSGNAAAIRDSEKSLFPHDVHSTPQVARSAPGYGEAGVRTTRTGRRYN